MFGRDAASSRLSFGKETQSSDLSGEAGGVSEATGGTAVQPSLPPTCRQAQTRQGCGLTAQLGGSKTTPSPGLSCYSRP